MIALRYAALLALVVWVGGLLVLGALAPRRSSTSLPLRHVADGRMLAGAIFGEMLRRFHLLSYACGAVLLADVRRPRAARPAAAPLRLRAGIALVMLAATRVLAASSSRRRSRHAQAAIGVAPSSLPRSAIPRRVRVRPAARAVDRAAAGAAPRRAGADFLGAQGMTDMHHERVLDTHPRRLSPPRPMPVPAMTQAVRLLQAGDAALHVGRHLPARRERARARSLRRQAIAAHAHPARPRHLRRRRLREDDDHRRRRQRGSAVSRVQPRDAVGDRRADHERHAMCSARSTSTAIDRRPSARPIARLLEDRSPATSPSARGWTDDGGRLIIWIGRSCNLCVTRITLIPGDGIGPEVTEAVVRILDGGRRLDRVGAPRRRRRRVRAHRPGAAGRAASTRSAATRSRSRAR